MRIHSWSASILVLTFVSSTPAAVLIVDISGSPGTIPDLQSAVNAAADGDILLVRTGDYSTIFGFGPIAIVDKSLTLVADPPGATVIAPGFLVSQIGASKTVVIRGIDCIGTYPGIPFPSGANFDAVKVTNSAGTVLVEDCDLQGGIGGAVFNQGLPGFVGVNVENAKATVVRCELRGGPGFPGLGPFASLGPGGPGAIALGGTLALFECTVIGYSPTTTVPAGAGIRLIAGTAMISGSSIQGGSVSPSCPQCAGGDGILADATSAVRWIDSSFSPGTGASSPLPIDAPPGAVFVWPGQSRSWTLTSPVVEFQPVLVEIAGVQGDTVLFFWSPVGAHVPIGGLQGGWCWEIRSSGRSRSGQSAVRPACSRSWSTHPRWCRRRSTASPSKCSRCS